jgi:hypothetical protein
MSNKLRAAAQAVLKNAKSLFLGCGDFNHLKKDLHHGGKCPPLQRYNDALAALKTALAEPEEKLLSIHRLDQWLKASLAEQTVKESLTVAKPAVKESLTTQRRKKNG